MWIVSKPQRRLFSDEGQIEDDSDNEDSDGLMNNRNPYKTSEPHPHLQVAFDLGMMGLEKIKERADEREDDWYPHYHRCPVKERLTVFCRYSSLSLIIIVIINIIIVITSFST